MRSESPQLIRLSDFPAPFPPCFSPDRKQDSSILNDEPNKKAPTLSNFFIFQSEPIHSLTWAAHEKKTASICKQKSEVFVFQDKSNEVTSIALDMRKKKHSGEKVCELKTKINEETKKQKVHPLWEKKVKKVSNKNMTNAINLLGFMKQQDTRINKAKRGSDELQWLNHVKKSADTTIQQRSTNILRRHESGGRESQDSIQYLECQGGGPGKYNEKINLWSGKLGPETFGKSQRFERTRPRTAQVSYFNTSTFAFRKGSQQNHISFLTSKANPRSRVKRLQYCDWARPHFYQQVSNFNGGSREHACFQSNIQRFKEFQSNQPGPGFYLTDIQQKLSASLPSYYFLSEVPKNKNLVFPNESSALAMAQDNYKKTRWNLVKGKIHKNIKEKENQIGKKTLEKAFKFTQSEVQNDVQLEKFLRKNSLAQRKRVPRFEEKRKVKKIQMNEEKVHLLGRKGKHILKSEKI